MRTSLEWFSTWTWSGGLVRYKNILCSEVCFGFKLLFLYTVYMHESAYQDVAVNPCTFDNVSFAHCIDLH